MNKPAPQEPSMDEILSSIRQIIADDDSSGSRRTSGPMPAFPPGPGMMQQAPSQSEVNEEPLALSPAQIVKPEGDDERVSFDANDKVAANSDDGLVDPDDVAFDTTPEPQRPAMPDRGMPRPMPSAAMPPRPAPASVSRAAPMPDPKLSADIAERLIEPATNAAVNHSLHRLSGMMQVPAGQTIDGMMRDMLRPMLKSWLDEHLPAVVERMVEREIARISRGIE